MKSKIVLKESVYAKLNTDEIILNRYCKKELKTRINYMAIIKIFVHAKKQAYTNVLEIKWCNKSNNSLVATLLECVNHFEQQSWLREFFLKIFYNFNQKFEGRNSGLAWVMSKIIFNICQCICIGNANSMHYIFSSNKIPMLTNIDCNNDLKLCHFRCCEKIKAFFFYIDKLIGGIKLFLKIILRRI